MKLSYPQFEAHLHKTLMSIYLISGEALLLKQDAIRAIQHAGAQHGFTERLRFHPVQVADWEPLHTTLYSASLLPTKRLIELDLCEVTIPKTGVELLNAYAQQPVADNLLIINIHKIDDKIAKSAWYKSIEKNGVVLPIWPIPRQALPKWIMERARTYPLTLDLAAANLLADYTEGNLIATTQMLEKLYLLKLTHPVDQETILSLLTDESRFNVFDLVETVFLGEKNRCLQILNALKEEGVEAVLILWALTRELRVITTILQKSQQGDRLETLFQQHYIFPRRQPALRHFLKRTSLPDCKRHIKTAAEIDKQIKGASPGNVFESLQLFCLQMV